MVDFFIYLILSVFISFGMSIAIVEKSKEWPLKRYRILLQQFVHDHIHYKAAQVFKCNVCLSFWICCMSDLALLIFSDFTYFFFPLSGFITLGFSWFINALLDSLNKEQNINIFNDLDDKD